MVEICDVMDECERRRRKNFRDELAQQNHEFHNAVLESSSSPRLYSITANLTRAPLMVGSFHFYNDHQLKRSLSEHRDLVGAIRRPRLGGSTRRHGSPPPPVLPDDADSAPRGIELIPAAAYLEGRT